MIDKKTMILGLLIIIIIIPSVSATWLGDYRRTKNVINPTSENLTDYPVYLNISYDSSMQSDFDDVRLTTISGDSLFCELEASIENVSAQVWCKVNLTTGLNQFYMYYGNSTASSAWDSSGNVWNSGYDAVFLMNGSAKDSTINNYPATTNATQVNGLVGGAYDYPGVGKTNFNTTVFDKDDYSIQTWIYRHSYVANGVVFSSYSDSIGGVQLYNSANNSLYYQDTNGTTNALVCTGLTLTNNWVNVFVTRNLSRPFMALYINGVLCKNQTDNLTVGPRVSSNWFSLGVRPRAGYELPFNGTIDDTRFSNVEYTPSWVNASYQFVANYDTFITTGDEFFINDTTPSVTVNVPSNFNWTSDNTPSITYTVIDDSPGIFTCNLIINGTMSGSNTTTINNTATTITSNRTLSYFNVYDYTVNCTDGLGNIGSTGEKTIYLYQSYSGCLIFKAGCYATANPGCYYVST